MRKNLLRINTAWRILFLRDTHPGRVPDQRIADTTAYPRSAGSQRLHDRGVQACTRDGVAIIPPTKTPRGQELTRAQKAGKRKVSRRRVRIDQVNSRVSRGRMLTETIRAWNAGIRDMVRESGCAQHNFRVRLPPSWIPMV